MKTKKMVTSTGTLLCVVITLLRVNVILTLDSTPILDDLSKDAALHLKKNLIAKVEQKIVSVSGEKLGTSSSTPFEYTTGFGGYASPLTSGGYAALGANPASFIVAPYQGGVAGTGIHHGHGQILAPGHVVGKQEHGVLGLGHGLGVGPTHGQIGGGYDGVVYGGYGGYGGIKGHPGGQEHVTINKQTEIGVGPFGEVHQGHTVQKSVNRLEQGGAVPFGMPYSPYGHGGVVYMGNGLISEHAAGVHLGPVAPPTAYQHQHLAINKQSGIGPFGNVNHGIPAKSAINSVGFGRDPYHQFSPKGFQPGFGGEYSHGGLPYPQHQEFSINKQAEVGVDPYGNTQKGLNVQKEYSNDPRFGYNEFQHQGIAHTDQAIIGRGHHPTPYYNGRSFSNPDPYYNNQIDPIYRQDGFGHAMTLQTTGPNRYYQGKNPIGVYERFHRLG